MNELMNEWMNEKPQRCMCVSNILPFLSKPEKITEVWHHSLKTVIIEVSTVQALRLRANPIEKWEGLT